MAAGTELAAAYVSLTISANQIAPQVNKQLGAVEKQADKSGKAAGSKFSSGMGGAFKGLAGMFAGAMAGIGVKNFLGDAFGEARESQKVGALTAQVIKTTGGAAKITADQVGDLATAISKKNAVDDEAVQGGANLLLTFTNVRNEVGAANDVFNQATMMASDMSTALGTDMKGASLQLGKALNDPVKGISALSRSGVSFTAAQKDQIKALVATGDTLGAQKIILAELGKEFGGAGAAAATSSDRAAVAAGNLKETIGTALLPVADKMASLFSDHIAPAISTFVTGMQDGTGVGGKFVDIFQGSVVPVADKIKVLFADHIVPAVKDFVTGMQDGTGVGGTFVSILEGVWSAGQNVISFLVDYQDVLVPVAAGILAVVTGIKAYNAAMLLWQGITKAAMIVQGAFNLVLAANPIGVVILALIGLGAALVVAYKKSETFRLIVNTAWDSVKKTIKSVVSWFTDTAWPALRDTLTSIGDAFKFLWNDVIRPTIKFIVDKFLGMVEAIITGAAKAFGWVPGLGGKLKTAAAEFSKFRDNVNRSLDGVQDKKVNIGVQFKAGTKLYYDAAHQGIATGGFVRKFADGGTMPGYTPGKDVHHFYSPTAGYLSLSGGEPVLRPEAGQVLGTGWVNGINAAARNGGRGGVQRFLGGFASGGLLPRIRVPGATTVDRAVNEQTLQSIAGVADKLMPYGGKGAIGGKTAGLVPEFLAKLGAWNQALGGMYSVFSGYRSVAHQWALWNASDKTGRMVAYPGRSRHNFGTAADLSPQTTGTARALAGRFGLSFPMSYEPWHIQLLKSGGFVRPFVADSGVTLAPGLNVVHNKLGKPEPLARVGDGGPALRLDEWTLRQLDQIMADRLQVVLDVPSIERAVSKRQQSRVVM